MQPLQAAIDKLREKQSVFGITLNPPAASADITAFEAAFQTTLPASIRDFYEHCNGFETNDWWFRLLPLEEMVRELVTYGNGAVRQRFVLAEYLIYSDTWEVLLTPESATGYYILGNDCRPQETQVILTDSITDFILRYLSGSVGEGIQCADGLYAWHDEITGTTPPKPPVPSASAPGKTLVSAVAAALARLLRRKAA